MKAKISKRPQWALKCAKAGGEFHIRRQSSMRHNLINILAAVALWGCVITLLFVSPYISPFIAVPFIGAFVGCCFFGHFILIIHECSHNMYLLGKNTAETKKLNQKVGTIASIPFFTAYIKHWENGHLTHHLRPCETDDPQNPDPLDGTRLLKTLACIWFIPFGFQGFNPSNQYQGRFSRMLLGACFWVPIGVLLYQISWVPLAILYVAFCTTTSLNLLKIAQEHGSGLANESDPLLRSRTYFYPLQSLFSPFCINYHFEHHANFNVPWYLLPMYHKQIQQFVPLNLKPFYFHTDYFEQMLGNKALPNLDKLNN
jgi:fatty acid desaturase